MQSDWEIINVPFEGTTGLSTPFPRWCPNIAGGRKLRFLADMTRDLCFSTLRSHTAPFLSCCLFERSHQVKMQELGN